MGELKIKYNEAIKSEKEQMDKKRKKENEERKKNNQPLLPIKVKNKQKNKKKFKKKGLITKKYKRINF